MIWKRFFLVTGLLLLQFLAVPIEIASSQGLPSEEVRVISLPGVGNDRANAVSFSPDGKHLAIAASAGIYIFDSQTLSNEQFIYMGNLVRTLAFSPQGESLAVGLFDQTTHLLSFPNGQPIRQLNDLGGWVRSVAFTPDGQQIAIAAGDAIRLWNKSDGTLQLTIEDLAGVRTLAISPDGTTLAIGLQDNSIQLRALSDGSLLKTLIGHEGWVRSLAFSPDGTQLASGAFDATARLWDVQSGELQHTLTDHQSSVLGIAFSPDGSTLATGSVDQTVRLWNSSDGALLRTFVGHGGFVYSVAFSPDGRTLASGANDNTVRLWNLTSTDESSLEPPATPSDCRACHHSPGSASPVAVIDVRCDACHPNGLGFNWCPFFPRVVNENSQMEIRANSNEQAGVSLPGRSLAVTIFAPANGEVIYSNHEYVAPLQVTGRVESSNLPLDQVEVHLEVWAGDQLISSLFKPLQENGQFAFNLGVNPHGQTQFINDPAAPLNCAFCHDDFFIQARVPAGELRLLVVAATFDGDLASDERWITADINKDIPLEVILTDASSGEAVSGLTIHASTRLYEWRGRISSGISGANGIAVFPVEMLSQAPTSYVIEIPDQVVDGVFYFAEEAKELVIDPQATSLEPINIKVYSQSGQINGTLAFKPSAPVSVWAIQLPAGPAFQIKADADGRFSFIDIPVAEFVVFADPDMMADQGLSGTQIKIDLTQSPTSSVELDANVVDSLFTGEIVGSDDEWLPFAWLVAPDGTVQPADIRSGSWTVSGTSTEISNWVVSAPGYYSQEVNPADTATLALERRSDLEKMIWGAGEIIIPSDTKAEFAAGKIDFESGWLWGSNPAEETLIIQTAEAEIRLSSGQFALERTAGDVAWFYLFSGQADVRNLKTNVSFSIEPGQMLALTRSDTFVPFSYAPAVVHALRSFDTTPTSPAWKPGLVEKFQTFSLEAGVKFAQLVTFITYFVAVISLVAIPWFTVRWLSTHRKPRGDKNE